MHFIVHPQAGPLDGAIRVPGDKSIGHRALLFGALADGTCQVEGLSDGHDNRSTRVALAALGVAIDDLGPGAVRVHGVGVDGLRAPSEPLDCGNSGTTMRLLCGLLAGQAFDSTLVGDASLSRRPMRRVAEPLGQLGARITGAARPDRPGEVYPPLVVHGQAGRLAGGDFALAIASAQVKSALILAALYARGAVRVREPGPSRDHTERMLGHMGAPLRARPGLVEIDPLGWDRQLAAQAFAVPGDPSSAAFLLAAALLTGARRVAIAGVCTNPTRRGFLDALAAMGAAIGEDDAAMTGGEPTAELVVRGGPAELVATRVAGDLTVRAIDEIPILAVVAARAAGVTEFADAGELRVKESDRIATTVRMLRALGVEVDERPDGLAVVGMPGRPFRAAAIDADGDHRIAMAGAVAALVADGPCRIDDVDNVATSFPGFVELMGRLGARLETG